VRLFFALGPPAAAVTALADWAAQAQLLAGGRLTRPESIHLTLEFLGEVAEERIADAVRAARSVRGTRHTLRIERAHVWAHNRIAWVGPENTPALLASLHQMLRKQLLGEGFQLEARPFAAHVTLLRNAREVRLPPLPALDWPVDEFTLVRSRLSAGSSRYEIVARFALPD
jgi:2'-5' RNA ligase